MKPFNLEEHLKNPSRNLVTRDGSKARIICTNANSEHPIMALVETCDYEIVLSYTKDGRYFSTGSPTHLDLFFATEKHEGWVNVYRCLDDMMCGSVFATEEDAKCNAKTAIATVKIDWEE